MDGREVSVRLRRKYRPMTHAGHEPNVFRLPIELLGFVLRSLTRTRGWNVGVVTRGHLTLERVLHREAVENEDVAIRRADELADELERGTVAPPRGRWWWR